MRSKFKWIYTLLLAFSMQFSFAQEKTISGTVTEAGLPLPGVNVIVKGTTRGTQTDFDGKYSIKAKAGEVLEFSFLGMKTKTATVGAANTINMVMEENSEKLEELIIEGYRNTSKPSSVISQSTVNSKTIENRPNASFVQTLQGQVAGLNITTGSGQPGARSNVLIRGANSISASTDPLYMIDGVPTNDDNFRSLNPSDIESVTVLKDAAATAIYGNRGSNGVIVITTKRGSFEDAKTTFRYSTTTGITQLQTPKYRLMNAQQLLTFQRNQGVGRGNLNPETGAPYTDQEIAAFGINTDWVDIFFRQASSTEHQFNVTTQSKNLNTYSSVSYLDQQGILVQTALKRFTFRNNTSAKSNDGKFRLDTNFSLGYTKNNEATNLGTGAVNRNYVIGAYISAPFVSPEEYQDPRQLFDLYTADGTLVYTPLFLLDKLNTYTNLTEEIRSIGAVDLSYDIAKNLTLRSRTSYDYNFNRFTQSEHPISFNAFLFLNPAAEFGGFEDVRNTRTFRFSQLWQAAYKKTFSEKHTFNLIGNVEYVYNQFLSNTVRQRGLNPRTFVPNTGAGYLADIAQHDFYGPVGSLTNINYDLISYFGIFDYDFDKRFGVVGTYRYDGTSRFDGENKWLSYWSVAGRWNIDNESFMKNVDFVNSLKLRASYGVTGNQRSRGGSDFNGLNPPGFIDTYANVGNVYNGAAGFNINFGDPLLRWESTAQTNIGLDFELFNNRFSGSIDWYKKRTFDLFYSEPTSPVSGTAELNRNSDVEVFNTGIDLQLSYNLIRNNNVKLTIRGNLNYNDNEVQNLPNNEQIVNGNTITENGSQVTEFFLIPYAGVNPANGNLLFVAADGSLTENPNPDTDRRRGFGSPIPIYQGGFGFDFDYKGFFISNNFTFVTGINRFDFDLSGFMDPNDAVQFNVSSDLFNAWTPTNTSSNVPALTADLAAQGDSDRFLRDASFLRLRYLQIGYRIPQNFIKKTFMSSASIYMQGENLFTLTKWQGFDAESPRFGDQSQYPTPRIFTLGLDIKF